LGQQVSTQDDTHSINGLAEAVDDEGTLLIRTKDGQLHRLLAGDVTLRGLQAI